MSDQSVAQRGGSFLINWVMLSAVGWAIGSTLRRVGFSLASATLGFAAGRVVEGAVIGVAIGIAQAIALPSTFSRKTWWVLGSTLAWAVAWSAGWSLGWSLFGGLGLRMVFVLMGGIAGTLAGIVQWLVLRRQVSRAGWWIAASTLGWAAGMGLAMMLRQVGWIAGGAVGGAITGLPLLWLLRGPTPQRMGSRLADG